MLLYSYSIYDTPTRHPFDVVVVVGGDSCWMTVIELWPERMCLIERAPPFHAIIHPCTTETAEQSFSPVQSINILSLPKKLFFIILVRCSSPTTTTTDITWDMQVDWNIILNLAALQICTCCVEENKTEVAMVVVMITINGYMVLSFSSSSDKTRMNDDSTTTAIDEKHDQLLIFYDEESCIRCAPLRLTLSWFCIRDRSIIELEILCTP